jgi:hypothetical protein
MSLFSKEIPLRNETIIIKKPTEEEKVIDILHIIAQAKLSKMALRRLKKHIEIMEG